MLIIKHFILSFTISITDKTGPTGLKAKTFTSEILETLKNPRIQTRNEGKNIFYEIIL